MAKQTVDRCIYHITHVDNLPAIIGDGCLWSDFEVSQRTNERTIIGYDTIKQRRLEELVVPCHPGTFVGHYVPFYFGPRSPMLFVIHKRNSGLAFQGGQSRIVHLVARIGSAVEAAGDQPWAFSDGNAGAQFARFCNNLAEIDNYVNWGAVAANNWSDPTVKERKQAEFLVFQSFPWSAFFGIGVMNQQVANEVNHIIKSAEHQPRVAVKRGWYY